MKFLMTLFQIQDYGGIINHAEYLAKGLKRLGHEVDFVVLTPRSKQPITKNKTLSQLQEEGYKKIDEGTGYWHHQARGWYKLPKVAYLNSFYKEQFKERCGKYDAILWHIPVPTLNKDHKQVSDWIDLYDNSSKNIAIIHDGNLPELYPHLINVVDKFHACVCVHESAYHSAKILPLPRKLILNPFDVEKVTPNPFSFEQRSGFAAIQVFKAWKRVDTLVRAIPHLLSKESKLVGGEGIEYRYMTSKEKCKPKYFDDSGNRIWEMALKHGMTHLGTVPNSEVMKVLKQVKLQIDPSFSGKYAKFGAHFNRTTVEAIIAGAVPMATDWGMKDSKIFLPNTNYIEIKAGCSPQEFAELIDHSLNDKTTWLHIVESNREIIKQFDKAYVAQQYVDLVLGIDQEELVTGKPDKQTFEKCNKNLAFFGISPIEAPRWL